MAKKFKMPNKKTTIILVALIIVLLIVAVTGTVVFLKDRSRTEAADLDEMKQLSGTQVDEQSSNLDQTQEHTKSQEQGINLEQTQEPETQIENDQVNPETQVENDQVNPETAVEQNDDAGITTQVDNIQETTIERVESVEIAERQISEGHYVGWIPMELTSSIESSKINVTDNNYIEISKKSITKSGDKLVTRGETITYTITVKNNNNKDINDLEVKDKIPDMTTYVEKSADGLVQEVVENENVIGLIWKLDLKAGEERTVAFKVTVNSDATGVIRNVALANGETTQPVENSVIEATKTAKIESTEKEQPAKVGDKITYTITVKNTGDIQGTANVQDTKLKELIDNGILKIDEPSKEIANELIEGIAVVVPENGEATISFKAEVLKVDGAIKNIVVVGEEQPEATVYTVNITRSKKPSKTEVKVGETFSYTITLTNSGNKAGTVNVRDTIPNGTRFESASKVVGGKTTIVSKSELENGFDVEVPGKLEGIDGKVEIMLNVTALEKTSNNEYTSIINNTAIISDDDGEKEVPSEEVKVANIIAEKTSDYEGKAEGEKLHELSTITYTITLTNKGETEGIVEVTDQIPEGTELKDSTIKVGDRIYTEKELTEAGIKITVPAKQTATLTFQVTVLPFEDVSKNIVNDKAKKDGEQINSTTDIAEKEYAEISGTKKWIVPEGTKYPAITINLLRDGVKVNSKQLKNGETTYTFDKLNKYDLTDKHEYKYEVEEEKVDGYTSEQEGNDFINTIEQEMIDAISGTKTWIAPEGIEHPTITINLLRDGVKVESKQLKNGETTYTFDNLDKYDLTDGHIYKYEVQEEKVDGYTSKQEGNNFINTINPGSMTIEGNKTWNDNSNQDGIRPNSIKVVLNKKVGDMPIEEVARVDVQPDENKLWKYKFENLPKYENGVEIVYSIDEVEVPGYDTKIEGYNIINTHISEKININGQKTWDDIDNKEGLRPNEITVNLLANGVKVDSTKATKAGRWTYLFNDLPKYSEGKEIKYTVVEDEVVGYTPTVTGYNISNKHVIKDINIEKTASQIILKGTTSKIDVNETGKEIKGTETIYNSQSIGVGDTIIYDIVVKNEGNETLTQVNVNDEKLVTIIGITPIVNNVEGTTTQLNVETKNKTDNLLAKAGVSTDIAAGNGYRITVSYVATSTDTTNVETVSNKATVTSKEIPNPEESTATVKVEFKMDYSIVKEIVKVNNKNTSTGTQLENNIIKYTDSANKYDTLTYKITAKNEGNTTIENLKISDDRNVKVLTAKVIPGNTVYTINKYINANEDLLDGNKQSLLPGETVEITVTYVIGSMDKDNTDEDTLSIVNTAKITGTVTDPNPGDGENPIIPVDKNATAIIDSKMKSDISINKTSKTNGQTLETGKTITYTVTLTNNSPVAGTTTVTESIPENTSKVGNITVTTTGGTTDNPTVLSDEQIEKMKNGELTLQVPGNGKVEITFTVKILNEAIGTTITNTAIADGNKESETIINPAMKEVNIYETKTELGKQSVVLVVDMTLSLAADLNTNNTDRLAYAPVNADGSINYEQGYKNTRWYTLKTALDSFIDSYLGNNPGNKKEVAIVGFCDGIKLETGFITSATTAKQQYANIFTQEHYTAAVKFAEYCQTTRNPEATFSNFFETNKVNSMGKYAVEFKKNSNGTYDIDVDILPILKKTTEVTAYTGLNDKQEQKLTSGTNIASGLRGAVSKVASQTNKNIITNVIIITDGDNNKSNSNGSPDQIDDYAKEIRQNKVNNVKSKLYAIGFTNSVTTFENLLQGQYDGYYSATNTTGLNGVFSDIKNGDDTLKVSSRTTIVNEGNISFGATADSEAITIADDSKVTIYIGEELTTESTIKVYATGKEFKESPYYSNNKFNIKQFLIDNNIAPEEEINIQIFTIE